MNVPFQAILSMVTMVLLFQHEIKITIPTADHVLSHIWVHGGIPIVMFLISTENT